MKGNLPSEQNFKQCTWSDVGYILIHGLCPIVLLTGQGSHIIGKLMTRKSGEDGYGISKIIEFLINAHQKVTSTEEDFNNHMEGMTCSVNTSQSLSPATHQHPVGP